MSRYARGAALSRGARNERHGLRAALAVMMTVLLAIGSMPIAYADDDGFEGSGGGNALEEAEPRILKQVYVTDDTKGWLVANAWSRFDAALKVIGKWELRGKLTKLMRSRLSNSQTGGNFYRLAQKFVGPYATTDYLPLWASNWVSQYTGVPEQAGATVMVWGNTVYTLEAMQREISNARDDFLKVYNGESVNDGDYDTWVFSGNTKYVSPKTGAQYPTQFFYQSGTHGTQYTNYKFRNSIPSDDTEDDGYQGHLLDEKLDFTLRFPKGTLDEYSDYRKIVRFIADNTQPYSGTLDFYIYMIPADKEFTTSSGTNSNYDRDTEYIKSATVPAGWKRIQALNVSDYLCDASNVTVTYEETFTVSSGTNNTSLSGTTSSMTFLLEESSINPVEPPDDKWPTNDPNPTTDPPSTTPPDPDPDPPTTTPEPPDPPTTTPDPPTTTPEPPVVEPTPIYDPPVVDPTNTSNVDYTPWLAAILAELKVIDSNVRSGMTAVVSAVNRVVTGLGNIRTDLTSHCQHLRDQMEASSTSINGYNQSLFNWAFGDNGRLEHYNVVLMQYLQELFTWLADQLRYQYEPQDVPLYDDSSVIGWLRKIYNKLGKDVVVNTPKDPVNDPESWWDWLLNAVGGFFDQFVKMLTDLGSGLPAIGEFLQSTFPFSIPWDIAAFLGVMAAEPVTPVFSIPMAETEFWDSFDYEVDLHFLDDAMATVRAFELFSFAYYLAWKTTDLLRMLDISKYYGGGDS